MMPTRSKLKKKIDVRKSVKVRKRKKKIEKGTSVKVLRKIRQHGEESKDNENWKETK